MLGRIQRAWQKIFRDLRERVRKAVDGGPSCHKSAERFGVSASSAIRWHNRIADGMSFRAEAVGGIAAQHALTPPRPDPDWVHEKPDLPSSSWPRQETHRRGHRHSVALLPEARKNHAQNPDIRKRRRDCSTVSRTLIRSVSSSSTRRGPWQTWHGYMVARPGATGCAPVSVSATAGPRRLSPPSALTARSLQWCLEPSGLCRALEAPTL
jgi:hypothetical protein